MNYTIRYLCLRPLRLAVRAFAGLVACVPGTTFGEIAEMAPGPCSRCVGYAVHPVPRGYFAR